MKHASLIDILIDRFADAIGEVSGGPVQPSAAGVRASQDTRFGDYQCNAAMGLARGLGRKPREIAERIVAAAKLDEANRANLKGLGYGD